MLSMLGLPGSQTTWLTRKKPEARIHVMPMSQLVPDALEACRAAGGYSCVVAIRPTGESLAVGPVAMSPLVAEKSGCCGKGDMLGADVQSSVQVPSMFPAESSCGRSKKIGCVPEQTSASFFY